MPRACSSTHSVIIRNNKKKCTVEVKDDEKKRLFCIYPIIMWSLLVCTKCVCKQSHVYLDWIFMSSTITLGLLVYTLIISLLVISEHLSKSRPKHQTIFVIWLYSFSSRLSLFIEKCIQNNKYNSQLTLDEKLFTIQQLFDTIQKR